MSSVTNDSARRRAQELWDRSTERKVVDARNGAQRAEADKIAWLRELRLAKEATDRQIAERRRAAQLHAKRHLRRRRSPALTASERGDER